METEAARGGELEKPEDAGKGEAGEVKRWNMEIDLAGKIEKDWRDDGKKAIERYRNEGKRSKDQFNIYWANVETLMPQLYATPPKPDVRRRFRDADPVGKLAAEVMERALEYSLDCYDFSEEMENVLLNYCIPSRGVARVRFEPALTQQQDAEGKDYESLAYAKTHMEHVPWDRFRRGPGVTWREVPWIAYEHQLTRDEVEKQFKGKGEKVNYDITMEGVSQEKADAEPTVFKRVRVWEIWDKQSRKIRFLAPSCGTEFLKVEDDKLELEDFFDCERPLYAVKTATTLVPVVEFEMYKDQARELDRVTMRIGKIVNALKVRGIYDSTINEFSDLFKASDNEMIPTSTGNASIQMGGMDKAVWMMPIKEAAEVLQQLVLYREQVKQTIYEITGMSDILRGATDPNETLGAQELKAQTSSRRVQRRARDVQRFIKGILRRKAEIIAQNYTPQLLSLMTGIQLPYAAQKAEAQQQLQAMQVQAQQAAAAAQATGQQPAQMPEPPPELVKVAKSPTWEDVMQVLKSDILRSFRIDIETDSTIAADQAQDREQIVELIEGIGAFTRDVGPAIQTGAISAETAKKVLLSCLRYFKMGRVVEDALEEDMEKPAPPPPPSPEMLKAELERDKQRAQAEQDAASQKMQAEAKQRELELKHESETKKMQLDHEHRLKETELSHAAKLQEIDAKKAADLDRNAQSAKLAEKPAAVVQVDGKQEIQGMADKTNQVMDAVAQIIPALAETTKAIGQGLQAHQQQMTDHAVSMKEFMGQQAKGQAALTDAITGLTKVNGAKRRSKAIRENGRIVGSESELIMDEGR